MSFNVLNRRIHYWASFIVAIPLAVIIVTGVMLQVKKQWTFVQPPEMEGTGTVPRIGLDDILEATRRAPGMNVTGWDDIDRLDVRPGKGLVKALLVNGFEVQVDLETGEVLQTARRRSDVIESIHDGSFFGGDLTKLGLFLPVGVTLFVLWLGGMWMWWVPFAGKRRVRRQRMSTAARSAATIAVVLLVGTALACQSPAEDTAPAPEAAPVDDTAGEDLASAFVPLLGHWEFGSDDGVPMITSDTTQWDESAPAGFDDAVLRVLGTSGPDIRTTLTSPSAYPIAISTEIPSFQNGTLSVEFNLIGGETDQIAGLIFNMRPNGDYHYVRYNTRDDDIAIWRFKDGARENLAHGVGSRRLDFNTWYPLVLTVDGTAIRATATDELTIEYTLDAPVDGRVGVWTKRDSITAFRRLTAQ